MCDSWLTEDEEQALRWLNDPDNEPHAGGDILRHGNAVERLRQKGFAKRVHRQSFSFTELTQHGRTRLAALTQ